MHICEHYAPSHSVALEEYPSHESSFQTKPTHSPVHRPSHTDLRGSPFPRPNPGQHRREPVWQKTCTPAFSTDLRYAPHPFSKAAARHRHQIELGQPRSVSPTESEYPPPDVAGHTPHTQPYLNLPRLSPATAALTKAFNSNMTPAAGLILPTNMKVNFS